MDSNARGPASLIAVIRGDAKGEFPMRLQFPPRQAHRFILFPLSGGWIPWDTLADTADCVRFVSPSLIHK